jgi:hypothetical protein
MGLGGEPDVSMRIIAAGHAGKRNVSLHFVLSSSLRLRLLNEAHRFES